MHHGRGISNIILLTGILLVYFKIFDISAYQFLSSGNMSFNLPFSGVILLLITLAVLIIDFAWFGGPWTPVVVGIISALLFQNWLIGLFFAVVGLVLHKLLGWVGQG